MFRACCIMLNMASVGALEAYLKGFEKAIKLFGRHAALWGALAAMGKQLRSEKRETLLIFLDASPPPGFQRSRLLDWLLRRTAYTPAGGAERGPMSEWWYTNID